jgi:DNA-binding MurR/RpiR family transcriptional regulator
MARLSQFVVENYLKIPVMSTREVAAAARVSLATVVRFPKVLGYADFDELRARIQDRVNFDLTGVDRLRTLPSTSRSPSALLRRLIDRDSESLRALERSFSEPALGRFTEALLRAGRVTILGFRYVASLAHYFCYALGKIRPGVFAWTQADSSLYDRARLMDKADLVVVIAFPRYPTDVVRLVRYVRDQGVKVLAITDGPLSPILPFAETALFARASMHDFVGSLAAPAALINCVVADAGIRRGARALERLERLEEAAAATDTYVSSDGRTSPLPKGRRSFWDVLEPGSGRKAGSP